MRSIIRSSYAAAPLLLGSTLVYALPSNGDRLLPRDAFSFPGINATTGSNPQPTPDQTTPAPSPTPTVQAAAEASTTDPPVQSSPTTMPSPSDDTVTQSTTNTWSISVTSGSIPNPYETLSALGVPLSSSSTTSAAAPHGSLAPAPAVATSHGIGGHGVLTGVVAGGLVVGLLCLTVGLWFCYRRRGPTSATSTPKYTTKIVGDDEKPRSAAFAFLRGGSLPWKKSHVRVRSSMSFASPILENEPKMVESNNSSVRSPLAPHLSGSMSTRGEWNNGRWSTFSTSDSSAYPQTPVGGHLSGIIMETVVETDAVSNPRTPTMASRQNVDYTDIKRSSNERILPPLATAFHTRPSPPGSNRLSDDASTPTTYSSGGKTFGSVGHGSFYPGTSDGLSQPPMLPTHFNNGSNSKFLAQNSSALLASKPRFDPSVRQNGSDTVSIDRESGETIKITNPFLDDEDGISSYGHGVMIDDDDGRRSIRTMDSDANGAYPSSTGCLDPKISPSPDAPITRPRSSLISDTSSDYPYPLGYAIDSDGNVANPFLRISELLEEVDGRMRWPSPPLLPRTESRNY